MTNPPQEFQKILCMYVCTRLFITVNIAVTLQITNNKEMKNTH